MPGRRQAMKLRMWVLMMLAMVGAALPASSQQTVPGTTPAPAAAAASGTYNIEIIVFRASSAQGGAENWSAERGFGSGDETGAGGNQTARFVGSLPASQLQLVSLAGKMKSSGVYVPVAHVGWSQTASAWGRGVGLPVSQLGIDVPGLTGTVTLQRGQYLHVGLNLSYSMSNPPSGLGAAPGTTFTINESRRVKFYERNYYDHPAFGAIVLITPAQGRPPGR